MLEALLKIKEDLNTENLTYPRAGICHNLLKNLEELGSKDALGTVSGLMDKTCESWEHYSGDMYYPVPSTIEGVSPADAYCSLLDSMWVGAYGDLRKDLLDHMIKFAK